MTSVSRCRLILFATLLAVGVRATSVWAIVGEEPAPARMPTTRELLSGERARLDTLPEPSRPAIRDGKALHPGDRNPAVIDLRLALGNLGYIPTGLPASDADLYDDALAARVRLFQADVGLVPDSVIGAMSRKALRAMDGDRPTMLGQTLDQPRLPAKGRYVLVNVAAGLVYGVDDGRIVLTSRAVIGRKENQTPVLSARIAAVWLNPLWIVPESIAIKEFGGDAHIEKPGPKNPLGRFLLEMPNQHEIFMHSTNEPQLFGRDVRPFSHGCVRVEEIESFARWLLGEDRWDAEQVETAVATLHSKRLALDQPVPVYIEYRTASIGSTGAILYHADPYELAVPPPDLPVDATLNPATTPINGQSTIVPASTASTSTN